MTTGAAQQQGDTPPADPLAGWVAAVADRWPPRDAEGWDQVGLHVGDAATDTVSGVLVSLDVTAAVLDEARERGANLVVAHHPLLFSPLRRLTPDTASGRLALQAARQGIAVLAAHTNVDKAADGTSHPAARVLGLTDLAPIQPLDDTPAQVKLVTFTPHADTDAVLRAMAAAGAGTIGDYTECAFLSPGTGTFRPGAAADPHIGTPGEREQVQEHRLEVILPAVALPDVVAALRDAHPYEEVPVDVYPTVPVPDEGPARGLGLVGRLPAPTPLREVAHTLAEGLPFPSLRLATDDPDRAVTTVAVCGGSGDSLIGDLLRRREPVDVFVTADLKHHPTLDALTMGLSLIDAGHFATEDPAMDVVAATLADTAAERGLTAPVHRSTTTTDPWTDWRPTP